MTRMDPADRYDGARCSQPQTVALMEEDGPAAGLRGPLLLKAWGSASGSPSAVGLQVPRQEPPLDRPASVSRHGGARSGLIQCPVPCVQAACASAYRWVVVCWGNLRGG